MLILSRYRSEIIDVSIGDLKAEITIVDVLPNGKVRVGLTGPKEMIFHRREVTEAIARDNAARRANGEQSEGGERA